MSNYAPLAKLKKGLEMPDPGRTGDSLPFFNDNTLETEAAPENVLYYLQMPDSSEEGTITEVCSSEISHLIALFWIPVAIQGLF